MKYFEQFPKSDLASWQGQDIFENEDDLELCQDDLDSEKAQYQCNYCHDCGCNHCLI